MAALVSALSALCVLLAVVVSGEEIRLGSRIFYTASDSLCPNSDGRYNDTKNTGSYLLSVRGDNYGQRVISTDILTDYWKSASHNCYRAHPTFIDCVQDVLSDLKTQRTRAIIYSGYKAYGDLDPNSATDQEIWASAGTGVELMYEKSITADIIGIAEAVLRHCPAKFERIQRNIGIIMGATSMHVHMTGAEDAPSFTVNGYTGLNTAAFQSWALTKIDAGLDYGLTYLDCSNINTLSTNQVYPTGAASAEAVVGEVDEAITRDNLTDFLTLVQFLRHDVEIQNDERTAAWCGNPSTSCVDCRASIVGNQAEDRCANRLVSARLNTVLHQLQINSEHYLSRSLKITKAFDEPRDSYTVTPSLHTEGRAVTVTLSSGMSYSHLRTLAKLAICSHADYVRNDGLSLFIAVRKQAGVSEELYDFPETELMRVLPPDGKVYQTELQDFDEATNLEYPLFDGSNQDDVILDDYATLGKFKSPSSRYLRVSPLIVKCYSALQAYYVEWENRTGHNIEVSVERAFLTTEERDILIGVDDPRYLSPVLGLSMELSLNLSLVAGAAGSSYPLTSLAKLAIIKCGPIFQEGGMAMGLGIYASMVYVDARDAFKVWNPSGSYSSGYTSVTDYNTYLTSLYSAATEHRMVDPDYPVQACDKADPPALQSPDFAHTHALYADHSRSNGANECTPAYNTAYCTRSATARRAKFEYLWLETQKMYIYHNRNETMNALDGCIGECGTCMEGSVYLNKIENCNNFIHWCPFKMIPSGVANINLFPRDKAQFRAHACNQGEHCIERSALFLLLVDTVESYYRPDPSNSVEEELYPQTENPSPVLELLHRLYAFTATGRVKVWVDGEDDLMTLSSALEAAMLYNTNIDEVIVYVNDPHSLAEVEMRMRRLITTWTTEGCPEFTREYIAPFSVVQMSTVVGKRSSEHNIRDQLIHDHTHRDQAWIHRYIRF